MLSAFYAERISYMSYEYLLHATTRIYFIKCNVFYDMAGTISHIISIQPSLKSKSINLLSLHIIYQHVHVQTVVYVPNHTSFIDILVMSGFVPRPFKYLSKVSNNDNYYY